MELDYFHAQNKKITTYVNNIIRKAIDFPAKYGKIMFKPLEGHQTWAHMLGYVSKHRGKPGYRTIDFNVTREEVEAGIAGLIVCGSTGEGATLTDSEQAHAVRLAAEAAGGRTPIVAGVGARSTAGAIRQA